MIQHYPQYGGSSKEDKEQTRPKRRADDRAVADGLATEPTPQRARKDRRRWCKGKVGVEHQLDWHLWYQYGNNQGWVKACTVCGKHFPEYKHVKLG